MGLFAWFFSPYNFSQPYNQAMAESLVPLSHRNDGLEPGYRADIDGLRAIAVLAVLFFHAGTRFLQGGFVGVDIFFVISGFLIGGHIFTEERKRHFRFSAFYNRRAKRILPALYVVLVVTLVLGTVLLSPAELKSLATESLATLASGSNIFFWHSQGYFAGKSELRPLLMTWSLGVEEQFYIFVPLLMIWIIRKKLPLMRILITLGLVSFAVACYQVTRTPEAAFYLLPGRAWELLAGVLLAIGVLNNPGRADRRSRCAEHLAGGIGFCFLIAPLFLLKPSVPFPGVAAIPSVAGTVLLLWSQRGWVNQFVLSAAPLRYVGRLSYSLYLWHWPLLSLAAIVLGKKPLIHEAFAILAIAFLLAMASYRLIEQPFRRSQAATATLLLRYAALTLLFALVFTGVRQTYGLAFRSPLLATEERAQEGVSADNCAVTDGVSAPDESTHCFSNRGRRSVALWGDSHVSALAATMRNNIENAGYDFVEVSKTACPPLDGAALYFRLTPAHAKECLAFNREAVKKLASDSAVKAVILEANWKSFLVEPYGYQTGWIVAAGADTFTIPTITQSMEIFTASLERTIKELRDADKEVIIFEDVPSFDLAPIWRWRTSHLPARRWAFDMLRPNQQLDPGFDKPEDLKEDSLIRNAILAAAEKEGGRVEDLGKPLCRSIDSCAYRDQDHLFYKDTQHLSPVGAQHVLARIALPNH